MPYRCPFQHILIGFLIFFHQYRGHLDMTLKKKNRIIHIFQASILHWSCYTECYRVEPAQDGDSPQPRSQILIFVKKAKIGCVLISAMIIIYTFSCHVIQVCRHLSQQPSDGFSSVAYRTYLNIHFHFPNSVAHWQIFVIFSPVKSKAHLVLIIYKTNRKSGRLLFIGIIFPFLIFLPYRLG